MLKNKLLAVLGVISLFIISFASQNVFASSKNQNDGVVSMNLVKETMKPQLISKNYQDQQVAAYRSAKLKEIQAEQARMDQEAKAQAEKQAQEKAAAAKQQQEAQQPVSQAPSTNTATSTSTSSPTSGVNKGTFKLSFYDPAVLGSNMGYGGVAANLSVFPKGTKLKITLSDGTVWYKVVNDTGSFAASNPRQLDVAMPNSQVPAAGILYATVEVIG